MAKGRRDCSQCTESFVVGVAKLPFRVARALLTFWNLQLFYKFCLQCGHRMKKHHRLAGGRFAA